MPAQLHAAQPWSQVCFGLLPSPSLPQVLNQLPPAEQQLLPCAHLGQLGGGPLLVKHRQKQRFFILLLLGRSPPQAREQPERRGRGRVGCADGGGLLELE